MVGIVKHGAGFPFNRLDQLARDAVLVRCDATMVLA
jgi:hypothetical protein